MGDASKRLLLMGGRGGGGNAGMGMRNSNNNAWMVMSNHSNSGGSSTAVTPSPIRKLGGRPPSPSHLPTGPALTASREALLSADSRCVLNDIVVQKKIMIIMCMAKN